MQYRVDFELKGDTTIIMTIRDREGRPIFYEEVTQAVTKVADERREMHRMYEK